MLLQTLALLSVFNAEVKAADVEEWTNQLHAQITVESAWRPNACSIYACGLAQFTLPTWGDIAPLTNPSCAEIDYKDPECSVRSQIVYMKRLLRRYDDADSFRDRWIFAWAAYNGGPGHISKEKRKCRAIIGCDPGKWEDNVKDICDRADWACDENRQYPDKIIREMRRLVQ